MKNVKKIVAVLCTALCLFAAIGLVGCDSVIGGYAPLTPLTEEETAEIRQAYFNYFIIRAQDNGRDVSDASVDKVRIINYCGTYGTQKVLILTNRNVLSVAVDSNVEIDGVSLGEWDASYWFIAYNMAEEDVSKAFTYLETAYENGTISKADLRQIAYYARQGD